MESRKGKLMAIMTHEDFLERLAPCIERADLDACVEEAARLAKEKGIKGKRAADAVIDDR